MNKTRLSPSDMRDLAKKALGRGGGGNETQAALWYIAAELMEARPTRQERQVMESSAAVLETMLVCQVQACPRCGGIHERLVFQKFRRPPAPPAAADHWATCPDTGDPVMLRAAECGSVTPA